MQACYRPTVTLWWMEALGPAAGAWGPPPTLPRSPLTSTFLPAQSQGLGSGEASGLQHVGDGDFQGRGGELRGPKLTPGSVSRRTSRNSTSSSRLLSPIKSSVESVASWQIFRLQFHKMTENKTVLNFPSGCFLFYVWPIVVLCALCLYMSCFFFFSSECVSRLHAVHVSQC